jgi:hypothetical protein
VLASALPHGAGAIEFEQIARAVVQRDQPEGARVEEQTTVALETSSGSKVRVETSTWQSVNGFAARGRVELDGHLFFEREWRA